MTRIVLAALLIVACDSGKPKDEPAKAATPGAETKPVDKPVEPPPAAGCDPEKLKEEGMDAINMGQHAEALAKMEASLACKDDAYVVQLAFMESCSSNNADKAKLYYKKLSPTQQTKFAQICIRNKTDYQ
jgi:hypothetical protein